MDDDDHATRSTPPKTPEEWRVTWLLQNRMTKAEATIEKLWFIVGPIHAAVYNWRAWLVIGGLLLALNSPKIVAALSLFLEKG